eukprot:scaffold1640_cov111-Isochrysis_galbana.AAC.24
MRSCSGTRGEPSSADNWAASTSASSRDASGERGGGSTRMQREAAESAASEASAAPLKNSRAAERTSASAAAASSAGGSDSARGEGRDEAAPNEAQDARGEMRVVIRRGETPLPAAARCAASRNASAASEK